MGTLHTVNKSPFSHNDLRSCLSVCQAGDAVLLIENGVLATLAQSPWADTLIQKKADNITFYALEADLVARGISAEKRMDIHTVDYAGFVQLTCDYERVQSWY